MTVPSLNTTGYLGLKENNPPNVRFFRKDPTTADYSGFDIGDVWINIDTPLAFMLMAKSKSPIPPHPFVANWQEIGGFSAGTLTLTPTVGGVIAPIAGNINVTGSNGILPSNAGAATLNIANTNVFNLDAGDSTPFVLGNLAINGANGIQVSSPAPGQIQIANLSVGMTWNLVTAADNPVQIVNDNGYIARGGAQVQFVLPPLAQTGESFKIIGDGNLWTISQAAGQSITLSEQTSTVGVLGSVTALKTRCTIEAVNIIDDTEWQITSVTGNLDFV